ncbi:TonB-dependent siderophore receptor [Methylomonas rivi]|uniref:TonB-dependent receptor n=1 Tax=Methylomonas rivi TaxID=2952226 RepID=A0ABT1U097_9GAMM|nr:TonB-dependent receptor [Methylomonas sp. WSC-6]MCQ8127237.1 TonB-dependent receptor [Methylomonas sp. WSC-6]
MKNARREWPLWPAIWSAILWCAQAGAADGARTAYAIPAQSLNNALIKFAADSKLELVFSADMVRGIRVGGLEGSMPAEQALAALLKDTGLDYRFLDGDTVTLIRRVEAESTATPPDPATLAPVTVLGQRAGGDGADTGRALPAEEPQSYRAVHAVTATRTATPVKQIPQSIQTLKRSLIDDQQNITVSEALQNVSAVVPRHVLYTPVVEGTLIRGFRAEQLLDGFTQYYNPGDRESMVNLERIEVLKGSNAVLYGGGSGSPVGGVVNLISKLPKAEAFAEAGYRMGSHAFHQPYFDWNRPLHDNVLFRVTGEYTASGSHVDNVATQRFNINPTLVFTNHDTTTLTLQSKISRWEQPDYQGLPATGAIAGDFRVRPETFIGPADISESRSNADSVWGSLDHTINAVWSLNLKARYAYSEFDQKVQSLFGSDGFVADLPLMPPSGWALTNAELFQRQEEYSVLGNALAKFEIGPSENTLLFGADYSQLNDEGFINADLGPYGLGVGAVDLMAPEFSVAYGNPDASINSPSVRNTTYGGYAQLQSSFYKRFHQLCSLRLGGLEIDFQDKTSGAEAKTQTLKPLPRIGGVFDVTDQVSLFAGYSEGMRGQPFVNFSGAPRPELSRQIEAGLKFDFSGRLSGQMAVYRIERSNVAVTDARDPGLRSIAAGQQRSHGFETDLIWQPNEKIGVLANYAHTWAEFTDDLAGVAAGNRLAMVPEDSGRLWVNYRFQQPELKGWSMGVGVYLRSGAYLSNNNIFKTGGYHSFDTAIAYESQRFKLAATVKNFTDEDYFQPYGYFAGRVAPAGGVSVFVTTMVKF